MSDPYIIADNVNVRYPVPLSGGQQSALGALANVVTAGAITAKSGMTYVEALRGVSLEMRPGDRIGLIGRNGAGKSTMLRLLGGTLPPSSGRFASHGNSISLLSLGAGMDPEESGFENIRRMCRLLGVPRRNWATITEDVVDFTELGRFLALPVRTYSSGMMMRLAFGLATSYPRDILIIDEIIGAGDAHFHMKAKRRMDGFIRNASILAISSHSKGIITDLCSRAIYLDSGLIVADGDPETTWDLYTQSLTF